MTLLFLAACSTPAPLPVELPALPTPSREVASLAILPGGTPLAGAEELTARFRAHDAHPRPSGFTSGNAWPREPPTSQRSTGHFRVDLPGRSMVPTPAVHQGVVLTSGGFEGEQMYAYAHGSGEPLWGLNLTDDGPSTSACEDGICVFNTESCTVFAVAVADGSLKWSYYLGDPQLSAPTIANGTVYTAYPRPSGRGRSHVLAAFDLQTGDLRWQTWLDGDVMTAPVVGDGDLYVSTFAGTLVRLDPDTGEVRGAWAAKATSAPVLVGDAVWFSRRIDTPNGVVEALAGSGAAGVVAPLASKPAPWLDAGIQRRSALTTQGVLQDASNGFFEAPMAAGADVAASIVGQSTVSTLQSYQGSRPVPWRGMQISTMGDEVLGVQVATGQIAWRHPLDGDATAQGGALGTPPVLAGDLVLVGTLAGEVRVLNPRDGREIKRYGVGHPLRSQPVVHEGWIYLGTTDGHLVGVDTEDPAITGWPQWGGDASRAGVPG